MGRTSTGAFPPRFLFRQNLAKTGSFLHDIASRSPRMFCFKWVGCFPTQEHDLEFALNRTSSSSVFSIATQVNKFSYGLSLFMRNYLPTIDQVRDCLQIH